MNIIIIIKIDINRVNNKYVLYNLFTIQTINLFFDIIFNLSFFFYIDTATTEIYTLSLHDALPISRDPDEFWHFQVSATPLAAPADKARTTLFPRYVESRGFSHRINARWLIHHARTVRGEQLLQIVRM